MRVVFDVSAVPALPVGAGAYTLNVARALTARDDVDLLLLTRRGDGARVRHLFPEVPVFPLVPDQRPLRLAWEQARGPKQGIRLRADVWHGPHYTLPLLVDAPAAVTIHDMTFFDHPQWHERSKVAFFRPMIRAAARRAAVLIAVSGHTAARLHDVLAPSVPVLTIPHGVDHDRFRPGPRGDAGDLAVLHDVGVRPPFVAFAGTLQPRKNVPALVRAFARLASSRPALRLVLVGGDGWGTSEVRDAIAASGVATRVLRLGYVAPAVVPALFRQAEAVAYPSHDEGFGLPALEALACGAALVTTTGSAMEEVVDDAALLVPPGDDDALTDALVALVDGGPAIDGLRARGPAVATPYTWERSAAAHAEAYRVAAGDGAAARRR